MFDVGFMELVLVSVIGLLVLGPQRLPKVAAEIGRWVGRARRTATQLRRQLEREIELSELQNPAPPPARPAAGAAQSSGEVPPGPGAHAAQPDEAEHTIGPAIDEARPAAGAEPPDERSVAHDEVSAQRIDTRDRANNG
jgi:Tat protein translocase TatB subunit